MLIHFLDELIYIPVMLCSWSMFLFIYKTLEGKTLSKFVLTIILIFAAANTIAVLTNQFTQIVVIKGDIIDSRDGFRVVEDSYGPWFLFHCAFSYFPVMMSVYYLLKHIIKLKGRYRVMVIFLLAGLGLTIVSTLLSVFDVLPWPIDTSPHTVQITLFLFYYSIFHVKSLSTVAIAKIGLFENADNILFIIDDDGNIADLNIKAKKLAERLGLNDVEGTKVDEFIKRWHEAAGGSYHEADNAVFTVLENNEETHYQVSRFHISDKLERQQGFYVEITNIEYLMKLTKMLNEANEASRAKSEFLSRMSHEIRTPMNAIIGMTQIGLSASGDTEKMAYCFGNIDRASKHLMSLINNILDLSKIEANKLEIIYNAFDFIQMLEDIKSVIMTQANEKKHNVEFAVAPDVPQYIISDRLRLSQVLINILTNAVKFTPDGGDIDVQVALISHTNNECRLRISVKDNGIGINAEQKSKVFESFEQADGTASRRFDGTGLGLAISKNIIEMMGGSLNFTSQPGKGSCFFVTIKVERCDKSVFEETHVTHKMRETYSKCRLLLAEDIDINREIVAALLDESKIKIDYAENGVEAVEMFRRDPDGYDIILMDVQMPVMDGLEATRQIRNSGLHGAASVPIIALTADAFSEDAQECISAGMNEHLGKPIDADKFQSILATFLRGKAD